MFNNPKEKVVKCTNGYCGQYFMHTEKALKCPFCKTEYVEVEGKASASTQGGQTSESASGGGKDLPAGRQVKKETAKTRKESFKIWGKN